MSSYEKKNESNVGVNPIAGRIGAEIKGIELSGQLGQEALEVVRHALIQHKVVFFREQHHLDDQGQEAFARLLGQPVAHPTVPVKQGSNFILELDSAHGGRANAWHTDVTFLDAYPRASILRAVIVPEAGGETVWANTTAAYQNLPAELRDLADRLWAVHSNEYDYAARRPQASVADVQRYQTVFTSTVYQTEHPVVRVIPETGERTLVLGNFARRIKGFTASDSAHVIAVLQDHITQLENTVRWHWQPGDVAIWDNRTTQHYAINDYGEEKRVMRRVTIAGDVPVSVDGKRSVTISKEEKIPVT